MYRWLTLSVVRELQLVPLVFDIANLEQTRDDARTLLEKLEVIHVDACAASRPTDAAATESE